MTNSEQSSESMADAYQRGRSDMYREMTQRRKYVVGDAFERVVDYALAIILWAFMLFAVGMIAWGAVDIFVLN